MLYIGIGTGVIYMCCVFFLSHTHIISPRLMVFRNLFWLLQNMKVFFFLYLFDCYCSIHLTCDVCFYLAHYLLLLDKLLFGFLFHLAIVVVAAIHCTLHIYC